MEGSLLSDDTRKCIFVLNNGQKGLFVLKLLSSLSNSLKSKVLWVYHKSDSDLKAIRRKSEHYVDFINDHQADCALGKTYAACVFNSIQIITPNLLCQLVETVQAKGYIIIFADVKHEEDLSQIRLNVHKRMTSALCQDVQPHFLHRAWKIFQCLPNVSVVKELTDDFIPQENNEANSKKSNNNNQLLDFRDTDSELVKLCRTHDQITALRCIEKYIDQTLIMSNKERNATVVITAGRGRGKSALLGLSVATALVAGCREIYITAPHVSNTTTLFQFARNGPKKQEVSDSVKVPQFTSISDLLKRQNTFGMLIIDEAAGVPLPLLKSVLKNHCGLVIISSTVHGYEGTGRSFSLKLLKELKNADHMRNSARKFGQAQEKRLKSSMEESPGFRHLTLETPLRYCANDLIEQALDSLFCLSAEIEGSSEIELISADRAVTYFVNVQLLFDGSKASEKLLREITALFVTSHYKNSPDDMLVLADSKTRYLCISLFGDKVVCASQLALEGGLSPEMVKSSRGLSGDLIPWKLAELRSESSHFQYVGLRVVRIATHPDYMRKGLASKMMADLMSWARTTNSPSGINGNGPENKAMMVELSKVNLSHKIAWIGTSFGLTYELFLFWKKCGLKPIHLRQSAVESTGENSIIMIESVEDDWALTFYGRDFGHRFLDPLNKLFTSMSVIQAASILDSTRYTDCNNSVELESVSFGTLSNWTLLDHQRIEAYLRRETDTSLCRHLWMSIARSFWSGKADKSALSTVQSVVLLGIGLQGKSADEMGAELGLKTSEVMNQFEKSVRKVYEHLKKLKCMTKEEVRSSLSATMLDGTESKKRGSSDIKVSSNSVKLLLPFKNLKK